MKKFVILLGVLVIIESVEIDAYYDPKYDLYDIGPLIENDRILLNFTRCFLDQGPCTPDAKSFKKIIPEALATSCSKCTPKQKDLIRTVIKKLIQRHPDAWKMLVERYDKEQKYRDDFNDFLNERT